MFSPIFRGFSQIRRTFQTSRFSSSKVETQIDSKTGIALVTLNRPPVNLLNLDVLQELSATFDTIEKDKLKGMILTSSSEKVFSAGLDLMEFFQPNQERIKLFGIALQDVWLKLYGASFPTAAAINGHAPAGGCMLATACEYRAMQHNCTIGLNDVQLGIPTPIWAIAAMESIIPRREAELALTLGKMFSSAEAKRIGLVDQVVVTKEEAIEKCEEFIEICAKVPTEGRSATKKRIRQRILDTLDRDHDLQLFLQCANNPEMRQEVTKYIGKLKKK